MSSHLSLHTIPAQDLYSIPRLIGHYYHFLERAGSFAKKQPRKYLWERNAYFHIPGAQDKWDFFIKTTDQSMTGKPTI